MDENGSDGASSDLGEDRSLLIVEDDKPFLTRLARAMEGRGFAVDTAESVAEATAKARATPPAYAVIDMRLGDGNGLDVVAAIREKRADSRTIILTGYGNIATAVTAVKLGAIDYLAKPADADDIYAALTRDSSDRAPRPRRTRCRRTACAGSISSASTKCATATCRKPRGGSTCTAARFSASSPSARRAKARRDLSDSCCMPSGTLFAFAVERGNGDTGHLGRCDPHHAGPRDAQHQRLAGRGRQAVHRGVAHDLRAVAVR